MHHAARRLVLGSTLALLAGASAAIAAEPVSRDSRPAESALPVDESAGVPAVRVFERVAGDPLYNGPDSGSVRAWHTIVLDEDALFGGEAQARQSTGEPVSFDLKDGHKPFRARRASADLGMGESEVWYGDVEGHTDGYALFVRRNGAIAGKVHIPDVGLFEILDAGNGLSIVREIDDEAMPPCGNTAAHRIATPNANDNDEELGVAQASSDRGTFIFADVLLLYTTAARIGAGSVANVEAQIELAIADTNLSYQTSGVSLRVRIATMVETPYVESPTLQTDLSRLAAVGDGFIEEAHTLRSQYSADLVALIPAAAASGACGVGYLMTNVSNSFASLAFNVSARTCLSTLTLAHELGHNMGCAHDRNNAGGPGAFSYSFGHRDGANQYRSVMSYAPGTRVKVFSNPNVNFPNGQPSGVPIESPLSAYNAMGLELAAETVAAWRILYSSPPGSFNLQSPASGATTASRNVAFTWSAASETDYYRITVDNDPNFLTPEIDFEPITTTTFNTPHNLLALGTQYYWKVTAVNPLGSATSTPTIRSFFTPAVSPSAFSLNLPANGAMGTSTIPSFQWALSVNADTYTLIVDDNSDFSSPAINVSGLVNPSYSAQGSPLLPNTVHYWKVTSTNTYGSTASTPVSASFTTVGVPPGDFALVSPPDGPNVSTTGPTLTWAASAFADSYSVIVDDSIGLTTPEYQASGIVGTNHQIPVGSLVSGVRYYWRVVSSNTVGSKVSSPSTYSFGVLVPFCTGDADRSLVVNFADISSVLANWGGAGPMGDANNNGLVNFEDISIVLSNWGAECAE